MYNEKILSVDSAKNLLLSEFQKKLPALKNVKMANGFVLAEEICAPIDLPPFDNSSMDGFAVRSQDTVNASSTNPIILKVVEDIPAGKNPKKAIQENQTSRIMTGAPLPKNADAVVPVESTNFSDRYHDQLLPEKIEIFISVKKNDYVRPIGQDNTKGEKIFEIGHVLKPHDLGFISGMGIESVKVFPPPKIALLSSGDEIIKAGQSLKPGQIYDINSISILTLLQSYGAEVLELGTAKDNYEEIKNLFNNAVSLGSDLIVSTAGVSLGVYDYVKQVLEENGQLNFWKVNMRPGKPLTFGHYKDIPFLGLPGNPVSAYVGSRIFLKPIIQKILGSETQEEYLETRISEDIESDGRESYLRVLVEKTENGSFATLAKHQGSGNMYSLVMANALLIVPAGVKSLPKGSQAKYIKI
ncbi:MAG: molybdopterin molybdotransferase MoeA [Anaerolineaceae bacterium]